MPQLSLPKLLRLLGERPESAVIFLHGDEEYLREEALRTITDQLLDPSTRDFNLDQLRGQDAEPETLASMLATPPMMAERRVVTVRDAQGLSPKSRDVVEQFLSRPIAGVVLILSTAIPSGSKAKFYDKLRKEGLAVEFAAPDPHDLPAWLVERAASAHGLELEMDAARALAAAIGPQLGVLVTELEKVAAYVGERRSIGLEDVRAVGGYVPRVDRWAWFDAVGDRRFPQALAELPELLESGESGVGLVIGLGGHLLRIGLLAGGGTEALERHLRPNQRWLARRLQSQARKWTPAQVDHALEELLRTDRLLKTAPLSDRQAMEELLLRLAVGEPSAKPLARAG